jgi:hypothetical protein
MMEDDNVTMRPPLLAGMRFAASRHTRNVPRTFTMNMASKSSMVVSASLGYLRFRIPAHAGHHDVRQGPNASSARLKSARTASGSDTSALTATARWPRVALRNVLVGLGRVGHVVDHDTRAERGEVGAHLAADAAGAASDQRDAAVERERQRFGRR